MFGRGPFSGPLQSTQSAEGRWIGVFFVGVGVGFLKFNLFIVGWRLKRGGNDVSCVRDRRRVKTMQRVCAGVRDGHTMKKIEQFLALTFAIIFCSSSLILYKIHATFNNI